MWVIPPPTPHRVEGVGVVFEVWKLFEKKEQIDLTGSSDTLKSESARWLQRRGKSWLAQVCVITFFQPTPRHIPRRGQTNKPKKHVSLKITPQKLLRLRGKLYEHIQKRSALTRQVINPIVARNRKQSQTRHKAISNQTNLSF